MDLEEGLRLRWIAGDRGDLCRRRRHLAPAVRKALSLAKHGLRFHDLRHTCASLLIAAGAHPHSIKEHLGHSDIRTTFNVYGHQLPSAREALSAALDVAYEGAGAPAEEVPALQNGSTTLLPNSVRNASGRATSAP